MAKAKSSSDNTKTAPLIVVQKAIADNPELLPYWNQKAQSMSDNLWLPSTDVIDSNIPGKLSWFSCKKWQNPDFTEYKFNVTNNPVCETKIILTKKIRIYPNSSQRILFNKLFGANRKAYNLTTEYLDSPERGTKDNGNIRAYIVGKMPDWAKEIPVTHYRESIEEACRAFKNSCKIAKETGKPFRPKFRSKKSPKQSCYISKASLTNKGVYYTIFGILRMSDKLPENHKDSRILCENGRWFLIVPYETKTQTSDNQGRVVALDPGIRTFLTCFAEDSVFKFGNGDFSRIVRLCSHMDDLISRMSLVGSNKRQRMKKALHRMRHRLKDLVDELHKQCINYLLKHYDVILMPNFNTQDMAKRAGRKIGKKSVRSMLTFAFYRFSQRLESKAKQLGKTVLRGSEAYTSKTASWNGDIQQIGGRKFITSGSVTMDRDINGARGIFLRALRDDSWGQSKCSSAFVDNQK